MKRTAVVAGTILAIALATYVLVRASLAVGITVAALLVAVPLEHLVTWLERRRVRRGVAIALAMLALLGALSGVALLLVPPAVAQGQELVQNGPELLARLRHTELYAAVRRHLDLDAILAAQGGQAPQLARELVDPAITVVKSVLGGVAVVATTLFVVVFMLASGPSLVRAALAAASPERRERYAAVLHQVYRSLGGYIAGLMLLVLSNATFAGVFLAVVGVPYFLPLAVASGLASLVPYAGSILTGAALSIIAAASGGIWLGLGTLGYFVAYQQFENHVLAPLVYRRTVDLNPLVILLSALFLTNLAGIPGALVAVPLAAAAQIVLRQLLRARRERLELERPREAPRPEPRGPGREAEARS